MFFTLDRIEDGSVAVLIDSDGRKHDVPVADLPVPQKVGNIYTFDGGSYIYNEKETEKNRRSNSEKLKKILNKAKNKK